MCGLLAMAVLGIGGLLSGCAGVSNGGRLGEGLELMQVRLLEGAITRDKEVLTRLLTPDFAWREDEAPVQETAFEYWDKHKLWGELQRLATLPVSRTGRIRVAPIEAESAGYKGAKVGWRQVGGEWRLAYFYAGSLPEQAP